MRAAARGWASSCATASSPGSPTATSPPPPPSTVDAATARRHAAMIAGSYITTRRSDSTFLSLVQLIQPNVARANPDGTITAAPIGQPETFVEVSPFLWRQFNGDDRIQATVSGGKVTRWSSDYVAPIFVYDRHGGALGDRDPAGLRDDRRGGRRHAARGAGGLVPGLRG